MPAINFNFTSTNVKGLKLTKKRIKLFEYFKPKLAPSNVLLAQETHSIKEIGQNWKDKLNEQILFSHGKFNSCGVFIAFLGSKSVFITKEIFDNNGRILVLQVKIDDEIYLLVNLYNSNTELEQLETLLELETILLKFDANEYNDTIFSGNYNVMRKVNNILEINNKFDLWDIWRIKYAKIKTFTFRQKKIFWFESVKIGLHFYFAKSSEKNKKCKHFKPVLTEYSSVFRSLLNSAEFPKGPGIWQFNNSLIFDCNFVKEMKGFIHDTKKRLVTEDAFDKKSQCEILKYEIRKLSSVTRR